MIGTGVGAIQTNLLEPAYRYVLKPAVGFLWFQIREFPRTLYDIYSLDGLEKWTKAWMSEMRLASHIIPKVNGIFDKCIETLEFQIDLYYATQFINSTTEFLETENKKIFSLKNITAIGNFLGTGKFLQKYGVFSFAQCTEWSKKCGSYKVFGERLDDRLVIRDIVFDKPKDLCTCIVSLFESLGLLKEAFWDSPGNSFFFDWKKRYELTGHLGKILLIGLRPYYSNPKGIYGSPVWYTVMDAVVQHVSLFGFILKKQRERDERFNLTQRIAAPSA